MRKRATGRDGPFDHHPWHPEVRLGTGMNHWFGLKLRSMGNRFQASRVLTSLADTCVQQVNSRDASPSMMQASSESCHVERPRRSAHADEPHECVPQETYTFVITRTLQKKHLLQVRKEPNGGRRGRAGLRVTRVCHQCRMPYRIYCEHWERYF